MWETIGNVLTSSNGITIAILAVLAFASMFIGLKHGRIKLKTDRLTIVGEARDKERVLMKMQTDFVKTTCEGFEKRIPRFDGYNQFLGELIAEKVYDAIVDLIMINHIKDDEDYIQEKQEIIWDIVSSHIIDDRFRTDKFKKQVYVCIEKIIKRLVKMRNRSEDDK